MQQEFYSLFMRKCPELKYLDMRSIKHQIIYFPEAKSRLETICELKCDTSIDSLYFYGLSRSCQHIQRLSIINMDIKPNHGIVRLIEIQKNLKYFEWEDDFEVYHYNGDPYEGVLRALEKKANILNHLKLALGYVKDFEHTLLQKILPKFRKLKTLTIDNYLFFTEEQLKILVYHDLEILNIELNKLNVISSIIENSGGHLKKILFRPHDLEEICDDFNRNSLNFIRKIYENCPSIEYLSIVISPSKENFSEFEKLLKICKNLKSLLLVILNTDMIESLEKISENGETLLKILINSTPTNLKEIRFFNHFKFSLENLVEFLGKWRGCALTILTTDSLYKREDYKKMIDKYKNDGIIKDFIYESNFYRINYHF